MSRENGERRMSQLGIQAPVSEDEEEIDEEDEIGDFQQEESSSSEAEECPAVDETVVEDEKSGVASTITKEDEEEAIREALRAKYASRRPMPALEKKELPPPPPLVRLMPTKLPPAPKTGTGLVLIHPGQPFLEYTPPDPEPYFTQRPGIAQDMLQKEAERMSNPYSRAARPVFELPPEAMQLLPNPASPSTSAPSLPPMYTPMGPDDHTLVFESRFESGNLRKATQVGDYEYDLWLKYDVNTRRHTQWYFFSVSNTRKDITYKFNIVNLMKPDSLYNMGLRPLVYSTQHAAKNGIGWIRGGEEICYYQNLIKRKTGSFYTFTFSYNFQYEHDTVYFAYCYPYTYTQLNTYLNGLESNPETSVRFRRRTLCQTMAGNNCDLLTITSFACDPEDLKSRKGIVITARVHPGESNASFMMKGVIDFLTGPSLEAKMLRDQFVFKVIPMMNPDGVINGNYRCSLAGCDLNRRWDEPTKRLHPTVYCAKMMIKRFMEDRVVSIFCDLHGHSRKNNIFIYGCDAGTDDFEQRLRERIFPKILHNISQHFNFRDCSFRVHKSKESTARVVLWKECGLHNSYTMEASFAGADFGPTAHMHFNEKHLEGMGRYLCQAILDYSDPNPSRVNCIFRELQIMFPVPGVATAATTTTTTSSATLSQLGGGGVMSLLGGANATDQQGATPPQDGGDGTTTPLLDRSAVPSSLGFSELMASRMMSPFLEDGDDSSIGSDDTPVSDPEEDKRKRRKAKRKKVKRKGDGKEKPKKTKDSDQEKADKKSEPSPPLSKKAKSQLLAKINAPNQIASLYEKADSTPPNKKKDSGKPPLTARDGGPSDWKNSLRSTGPPPAPPPRAPPPATDRSERDKAQQPPPQDSAEKKKSAKEKTKTKKRSTAATASSAPAAEPTEENEAQSDHMTRVSSIRKPATRPTSASAGFSRRYKTDDEGFSAASAAAAALALAAGLSARGQKNAEKSNPLWDPEGLGRPGTRLSKALPSGKAVVPTVYRADVAMGLVDLKPEELPRIVRRRSASNRSRASALFPPPELF